MTGSIFLTRRAVVRKIPSIGCDENGCYYSSDNEPKGWYWVKNNKEVIYFSQDYAATALVANDQQLSWLMAQVRRDKEEENRRERREIEKQVR